MPHPNFDGLYDANMREQLIKHITNSFARSPYGDSLRRQLRWSRYRPAGLPSAQWAALIGKDAHGLSHMRLMREQAAGFLEALPQPKKLDETDTGHLLLAASVQHWGRARADGEPAEDVDWETGTPERERQEREAFKRLFDRFLGEENVKLKYILEQTVFNPDSRLGILLGVIERLNYLSVATRAYEKSKTEAGRQTAGSLQWLFANVASNQLPRVVEYAKLYAPAEFFLQKHGDVIEKALREIPADIFAHHGFSERIRHERLVHAKEIWATFSSGAGRAISEKKSYDRGIFGQGTNFHKRFVADYDTVSQIADSCRVLGLHIVMTSGSYDLLHIGHVKYLEKARSYGDILFVGVDSDAKVRKRKGSGRPIVPEQERLETLSHVRHVDVVTLKTPGHKRWELISRIRPDTLIATAETYTPEEIRELEGSYCGKVVILEPQGTASTSAKIRRLQIGWEARLLQPIREIMQSNTHNKTKMESINDILKEAQESV